ncbi:winged helix DNA-binding domain-containing protein [Parabacteroides provencensis]|uniref:winged helix DNA-binding domain-containing protein n=1 Tax=Parabacteroides provencensis TaxID=1944636 RepID=UPI000C147072|nr:winged helix DNA-binding domain-containing protein [Parabacteroides provencensis]
MIKNIRMASQQLASPNFEEPKALVSWMGAIQAQDYAMSKWAVGSRLQSGSLKTVDEALKRGEILRTHVLRPTWHLVAAEDIRWMLKLSVQRIKSAYVSFAKGHQLDITEKQYGQFNDLIVRILEDNKSLTKQEIEVEINQRGIKTVEPLLRRLLGNSEIEGVICSGVDKGNKPTYALLDERAPRVDKIHKEEALARLASRYFQSHSPASLVDFSWWSGLSLTEAKQAIGLIKSELITDSDNLFMHESYEEIAPLQNDILHLLPSFDEYLISYKDRTAVLDLEHHPKAFNRFGTFYPVILHNGKVVGNWNKTIKKGQVVIKTSFFDAKYRIRRELIQKAESRYKSFICNQ